MMFCDLVASTGIAAKLDAEEWRDLVGAYLEAASAAVAEMGGKVAKKLGDGLMALFGYPVAQENDAARAARAARALADLNHKNASSAATLRTSRLVRRRWLNRARSWSRRECSARSLDCSSPKSAEAMNLKGCRSR
jgi:class 3 adenylate cyclase